MLPEKNKLKMLNGQQGGLVCGTRKISGLSETERLELSKNAIIARWGKTAPDSQSGAVKKLVK